MTQGKSNRGGLLLASGNKKKAAELLRMLDPLGIALLRPSDVGGLPEVIEDKETFEGNARKKALSAAEASGEISLADDSGLCVDALGGRPGVHSARFSGVHGDDAANNARLLEELAQRPGQARTARFVCCLSLVAPGGEILAETRGEVTGLILEEARGSHGFGYDPLFQIVEPDSKHNGRAMAELSAEEKSAISHRGRALKLLARGLKQHFC